jgi:hypothetical protein
MQTIITYSDVRWSGTAPLRFLAQVGAKATESVRALTGVGRFARAAAWVACLAMLGTVTSRGQLTLTVGFLNGVETVTPSNPSLYLTVQNTSNPSTSLQVGGVNFFISSSGATMSTTAGQGVDLVGPDTTYIFHNKDLGPSPFGTEQPTSQGWAIGYQPSNAPTLAGGATANLAIINFNSIPAVGSTFTVNLSGTSFSDQNGNAITTIVPSGNVTITVVPEPNAAFVVGGILLAFAGCWRWKRFQAAQ